MTTQYASYERTVTITLFSYTATVVTQESTTTATLTVREDLDTSYKRQIQCPGCSNWYRLQWEGRHLLPVHCTGCVLALYNITEQPAPATVTTEPVAEKAAEPVASIEASESACEAEPQTAVTVIDAQVAAMSETAEQSTKRDLAALKRNNTWQPMWRPGRGDFTAEWQPFYDGNGNIITFAGDDDGKRYAVCFCLSDTDVHREYVLAMHEQSVLVAELAFEADAVIDHERYVAIRSGKYVLWCRRADMFAEDCSCPSRTKRGRLAGRACKHQMTHNATRKTSEQAA